MGTGTRSGPNVLIVEDDSDFRQFLCMLLSQAGYEATEAATGEDALEQARRTRPGLVVLDVRMPGVSGYEVCRALREEWGEGLPIMFVSGERMESFDRVAGFLIGADDYLVKPFATDEFLARVRRLCRSQPSSASPPLANFDLTRREREILELLAEGLSHKDIAARLVISPKTVGTHIEHIFSKLGVRSRAQAVALVYRQQSQLGAGSERGQEGRAAIRRKR